MNLDIIADMGRMNGALRSRESHGCLPDWIVVLNVRRSWPR